eukprot:c20240_g1_i1.p1 GENE.c20240_g1_i1~~c20240_g1_i1.p1  ORF type:complete len:561 (-),score=244.90 c20240_g1_i1:6-1688(-)
MEDDPINPPPSPPPPPPPAPPSSESKWPWIIPPGLSDEDQNHMLTDPPSRYSEPSLNRFHEHRHNFLSQEQINYESGGYINDRSKILHPSQLGQLQRSFLPEMSSLPSIGTALPGFSSLERHSPSAPQYKSASDTLLSHYTPSLQHHYTPQPSPKSLKPNSSNSNDGHNGHNGHNMHQFSSLLNQKSGQPNTSSSSPSSSVPPSSSQNFSGLPTLTSLFVNISSSSSNGMGGMSRQTSSQTTSLPAKYPSTPSFPAVTSPQPPQQLFSRPQSLSDLLAPRLFHSDSNFSFSSSPSSPRSCDEQISSPTSQQQQLHQHHQQQQRSDISVQTQIHLRQARQNYQYALTINPPAEELWYADRHYPPITVELIDLATEKVASGISGWTLSVSLLDGFGQNVSDLLTGRALSDNHLFTVNQGRSSVGGIRFSKVSSKNGGFFQLVISLVFPDSIRSTVAPCSSGKIQVLSYRLYHAPKVPMNKLRGSDPVARMKGIGSLYAQRLAALGIERVEQLAQINIENMGTEECQKLVENLRKDRGAMTPAKLMQYIAQAREIVIRDQTPE